MLSSLELLLYPTSHVAAWLKLRDPDGQTERGAMRTEAKPMTQWVHLILPAASPVPQTLNNSATWWQASITMVASSHSLRRLKQATFSHHANILQPNINPFIHMLQRDTVVTGFDKVLILTGKIQLLVHTHTTKRKC